MTHRIRNAVLWLMNWRTKRFWVMVFVVWPIVYVLSTGPINWLLATGMLSHSSRLLRWTKIAYWPFSFLYNSSDTFRAILGPYTDFWRDLARP